jgi:mono/diheme cytochrome c family protein
VAFSVVHAESGVLARFEQGNRSDALVLPNAALSVAGGTAPTSFLDPGEYNVELSGAISVDLRAQYAFQVEATGKAELLINGKPVISFAGGALSDLSAPIRLSKGTNAFVARLSPGPSGEIQFRLLWKSRNMAQPVPIPPASLSHDESDPLLRERNLWRNGLAAFAEYRCIKCHQSEPRGMPELEMDAPDLTAVGSRLRRDWLAKKIANPGVDSRMPRLVTSDAAAEIADYLATIEAQKLPPPGNGSPPAGEKLFTELHCIRCHNVEDLSAKYKPGALERYLQNPQQHYRWNRMPNFKLTMAEAADLGAYLYRPEPPWAPTKNGRGKELLQTAGCLSCHSATAQNQFRAKPLNEAMRNSGKGCLDTANTNAPRFAFREGDREALVAFLKSSRTDALGRNALLDFTLRRTASLGCAKCHDANDGVIRLDLIGGKLRPEWVGRFLSGDVSYKPRPWLAARMPAFHLHGPELASGLAALHGIPAWTRPEGAINQELATAGAKLVSSAGGFSCVACHAIAGRGGSGIVESPGIDLAYSGERLLKSFFHRWVLNPLVIDPATKMPVYFDENGRSQLIEFFDGDATQQIEAIWQYVRLGDKMPPPPVP